MGLPTLISTTFIAILVAVIILLLLLSGFLIYMWKLSKKETASGEADFEIIEEKMSQTRQSPARKRWAKAGSVIFDIFIGALFLAVAVLIFTRAMPNLGIPYSLEAVRTPSMASVDPANESYLQDHDDRIYVNDIVILEKVDSLDEIKLYDVVSYKHPQGINVIHRVVEIHDGYLITRGDANAGPATDGVQITLDMINGRYTGVRIPVLGAVTFYLQDDYGIVGMSALAYVIIAAEFYFLKLEGIKEERFKEIDRLFKEGALSITIESPDGLIRFDSQYQGTIDKNQKSSTSRLIIDKGAKQNEDS